MIKPAKILHQRYAYLAVEWLAVIFLIVVGLFHHTSGIAQEYPIQGFDVSHHQGDIQWSKISPKKFQFVYLKATEGGDFKDTKFQENWLNAREQGLLVGAYHFYHLCKEGKTQAENFIASVPKKIDAMPPVIDLEYDSKCINAYTQEQLIKEIQIMHDLLFQHYEKQPIFYTSKAFYNIVLVDHFPKIPLWIREYKGHPNLKNDPKWIFWQHTYNGKINGINKSVDLNVFNGSQNTWIDFLVENHIPSHKYVVATESK